MDIAELKTYIYTNDLAKDVLSALGCTRIKSHSNYISAANPDGGDNPNAIILYLSEALICIDYTRNIINANRATDIFDLISYFKDCNFFQSLKWVCDTLGLDYYSEPQDVPESLQIIKLLKSMSVGEDDEDDSPVKPISENILDYYLPYGNKMWEDEGISLSTQADFKISYDPQSNYIAIPIYDSVGSLVGVKGRYFGEPDEWHSRFIYLEKCNKSKILYGLWENRECIKNSNTLIIVESEKSVLKAAELGYRNVVATGGKTISKYQIELITRTGCTPILALDKDVDEDELRDIANMFMDGITVYAVIDKDNILDEKESPPDNPQKWQRLIKNNIYKIKGGDSNE